MNMWRDSQPTPVWNALFLTRFRQLLPEWHAPGFGMVSAACREKPAVLLPLQAVNFFTEIERETSFFLTSFLHCVPSGEGGIDHCFFERCLLVNHFLWYIARVRANWAAHVTSQRMQIFVLVRGLQYWTVVGWKDGFPLYRSDYSIIKVVLSFIIHLTI